MNLIDVNALKYKVKYNKQDIENILINLRTEILSIAILDPSWYYDTDIRTNTTLMQDHLDS